jgi:hypothetical protein
VTIIGVLVTLAIVYMRPRVRAIDVANRVGDLVHEAGRRAVALGPVRSDVALALGGKARTQILATQPAGGPVTFTLYLLQEAVLPSNAGTWNPVASYIVDRNVTAFQWAPLVGNSAMAGQTGVWDSGGGGGFRMQCRPDGTCDSFTLFFQAAIPVPTYEAQAKLAIMPLGGAINTRMDWN